MDDKQQEYYKDAKEKLNLFLDHIEEESYYCNSFEIREAVKNLLKNIIYTFDYDSRKYIVEDLMEEVGIEIYE